MTLARIYIFMTATNIQQKSQYNNIVRPESVSSSLKHKHLSDCVTARVLLAGMAQNHPLIGASVFTQGLVDYEYVHQQDGVCGTASSLEVSGGTTSIRLFLHRHYASMWFTQYSGVVLQWEQYRTLTGVSLKFLVSSYFSLTCNCDPFKTRPNSTHAVK